MIYLAGYTGRTPAQLLAAANDLDALVVDIRFSPVSRVIHWQQRGLQALLGRRYRWIKELGNPHYKNSDYKDGAEMCLYNPDNGIPRLLETEDVTGTIIVLCACADQLNCHRWLVAQELLGRGRESFELDWCLYPDGRTSKARQSK